jgi:hypothetical protein
MKLDLGCGSRKHPGFLGMDAAPLDGVDIVCGLNDKFPLPDDSVEFVMAARTLPFVQDLFAVLGEIYRVSMHKAVVCILAPYAHTYHYISNPHIRHKFDEHTPRHLTPAFYQPPQGPACPEIPHYADVVRPSIDFRLLRMELFYLPPYRSPIFEEEELEILQQLQLNVVDEIMYHFLVVKEDIELGELDRLSRTVFEEPVDARELRAALTEEDGDGASD